MEMRFEVARAEGRLWAYHVSVGPLALGFEVRDVDGMVVGTVEAHGLYNTRYVVTSGAYDSPSCPTPDDAFYHIRRRWQDEHAA